MQEVNQGLPVRKELYAKIESDLDDNKGAKTKLVAFFTSFKYPVLIEDQDADMLEEVLSNTDLKDQMIAYMQKFL